MTTALHSLLWATIAGVTIWDLMLAWTKRQISLIVADLEAEISFWQRKAELATGQVTQLARDAELREQAWRQGRDDVIAIIPLIRVRSRSTEPPKKAGGAA